MIPGVKMNTPPGSTSDSAPAELTGAIDGPVPLTIAAGSPSNADELGERVSEVVASQPTNKVVATASSRAAFTAILPELVGGAALRRGAANRARPANGCRAHRLPRR
jgi:hypothetical protein